jgi:sulfatase modifying factor 1
METWLKAVDGLGERRAQALGAAVGAGVMGAALWLDGVAPWVAGAGLGAVGVRMMLSGSARVVPVEDWLPASWGRAPRPVRIGEVPSPDVLRVAERPVMVWVPGGVFWMGSGEEDPLADQGEKPRFRCRVADLAIGATPVTRRQWAAVMGEERGTGEIDAPVNEVSWLDAVRFCNRWSELEGLEPCYAVDGSVVKERAGDGYRLPTEAEWEYACRAGTETAWSCEEGELSRYAWYLGEEGEQQTHPVAMKLANPWGLFDMHGNVWEWCSNGPAAYPGVEVADPFEVGVVDTGGNEKRFVRGGSAWYAPRDLRSGYRFDGLTRGQVEDQGFRCVRVPVRQQPG